MSLSNSASSYFHFPTTNDEHDESTGSILAELSNPLSSIPRLQGKIHKSSVNGHLSVATILSSAFLQPTFPLSAYAITQSGQLGLTFSQFDNISRRVAMIISAMVISPGSDYQVSANNDGDSVIMLFIEDNYISEQIVVLIFAILRLGATYMIVQKEDFVADIKAWRQLIALIEPIMIITFSDPLELPVPIRNEFHIVAREDFEDYEEEEELNANVAETDDRPSSADSFRTITVEKAEQDTIAVIRKIRSSLILETSTFKPTAVSSKVIWDLALELKVSDYELHVTHFKSDVRMGQRTAFIFQCCDTSGKIQWCKLSHRAIRNRIAWERIEFPMKTNEKCYLSFTLDDPRSLVQIFNSFIHGKALILGAPEDFQSVEFLLRTIGKERQIKRLELTPSRLQLLLDAAVQAGLEMQLLHIKTWLISGPCVSPSLAKYFFRAVTSNEAILVTIYGKAEVAWCSSFNMFANVAEVNKWSLDKDRKLAVGIPIANTNIFIMDEKKLKYCHYGQKGEICITGPMIYSSGYCGSPVIGGKHGTIFPTGDIGRIIQDRWGCKQLLVETTTDSRVMLKGKVVDLDELTRVLKYDSLIRDSFVFVCRRGRDDPVIVVAISSKDSKKLGLLKTKIFRLEPLVTSCFHINNIPMIDDNQVDVKSLRAAYFKFLGKCGPKQWDAMLQAKNVNNYKKGSIAYEAFAKTIQVTCKAVAFSLGLSVVEVIEKFDESYWDIGGTPLRAIMTVKSCLCQAKKLTVEDFALAETISELSTRLVFAEKDEVKWNQSVYLTRRNFIYSKMAKKDRKEITEILLANFSQIFDQRSTKDAEKYATAVLNTFDNSLSAVALTAETSEVVGVAFNYKSNLKSHFMPAKIEEGVDLFNMILQSCRHLTKGIENKSIVKSYLISLKSSVLNPIQCVLVIRDLINESVKNTTSAGCKGYFLCTMDPLVQEICCSLLGFEILTEVQLNLHTNKKLQKPFMHLDDHQMVGAYFKRTASKE